MKKITFSLLFVFAAVITFAQEKSKVRLGLTAHPNFGFLKVENGKGDGVSLGFAYGLLSDIDFAENYSFATGLQITSVNGAGKILNYQPHHGTKLSNADYDTKFKMQYIEVPLSIKLKTEEVADLKWYGQFGLTTGFRISAKMDVEADNTPIWTDHKANGATRFFRAGMLIGGGAEYRIDGKTSLLIGATYNNGLTNIGDSNQTVKNHYVNINFGVFF